MNNLDQYKKVSENVVSILNLIKNKDCSKKRITIIL